MKYLFLFAEGRFWQAGSSGDRHDFYFLRALGWYISMVSLR